MRHRFPAYPADVGGIGLLLMRGSAATLLILIAVTCAKENAMFTMLLGVAATALVLGISARVAASLSVVLAALTIGGTDPVRLLQHVASLLASLAIAVAGPGVWSVDAVRFGRRTIQANVDRDTKV